MSGGRRHHPRPPTCRSTSATRPWQRGSNENTNGLLRQYVPTGVSLARHTHPDLQAVALELNDRSAWCYL